MANHSKKYIYRRGDRDLTPEEIDENLEYLMRRINYFKKKKRDKRYDRFKNSCRQY